MTDSIQYKKLQKQVWKHGSKLYLFLLKNRKKGLTPKQVEKLLKDYIAHDVRAHCIIVGKR